MVLRREAFRQVGGFAERLGTYGEEALLAMDLVAAGWHLAYVEQVVAHHLPLPAGRARYAGGGARPGGGGRHRGALTRTDRRAAGRTDPGGPPAGLW